MLALLKRYQLLVAGIGMGMVLVIVIAKIRDLIHHLNDHPLRHPHWYRFWGSFSRLRQRLFPSETSVES